MEKSDAELIKSWKSRRDQAAYAELKSRYKLMVLKQANIYRSAPIAFENIVSQAWLLFDDAVNSFNPNMGAGFSTRLGYTLKRLDRYVKTYQNMARIPENQSAQIGTVNRARGELRLQLGREPSDHEVGKKLKLKTKVVTTLRRAQRKDLFEGLFEENPIDMDTRSESIDYVLRNARFELNQQEREVYDRLMGFGGKPKARSRATLAKSLGMSQGRLSQITSSIAKKIKPHLHGVR